MWGPRPKKADAWVIENMGITCIKCSKHLHKSQNVLLILLNSNLVMSQSGRGHNPGTEWKMIQT
jgi:hypothetical protein